jgi:plasmid stabilization system protein ParE
MTDFQVIFAATAKEDLEDILYHIAQDSIENAISFVDKLTQKIINTLSIAPQSGTSFGVKWGSEVRTFVVHKSYTVFYMINNDDNLIEIISVFNTHKDNRAFWAELKSQGIHKFPSTR